jgi:hypothetical protein
MPEAVAEAVYPRETPADVFPPDRIDWLRPKSSVCPTCRHPSGPDGARIEGADNPCKHGCHDSPEEDGR